MEMSASAAPSSVLMVLYPVSFRSFGTEKALLRVNSCDPGRLLHSAKIPEGWHKELRCTLPHRWWVL